MNHAGYERGLSVSPREGRIPEGVLLVPGVGGVGLFGVDQVAKRVKHDWHRTGFFRISRNRKSPGLGEEG